MTSWWLNVFFLIQGVWTPGYAIDGWSPIALPTQEACQERKSIGEENCARLALAYPSAWVCSPDQPLVEPPPELNLVQC